MLTCARSGINEVYSSEFALSERLGEASLQVNPLRQRVSIAACPGACAQEP
jgi:hypothetical protein